MEDTKAFEMEYVAIREEVVSLIATKDQLIATMYTLCIMIIGFVSVLNMEQVIGLIFVVLIPFQAFINTKNFQIARCGAYISYYIEPKIPGMNWEAIIHNVDLEFNKRYRVNLGKIQITRNLGKFGASIFATIAILFFAFKNMSIQENIVTFNIESVQLLLVYLILTILTIYLNRKGTDFETIYSLYISIFEENK